MSGELTTYAELAEVIRTLPNICHEVRRSRDLSLRAAAKEAGVSFSSLLRFEDGENGVNVTTLVAIMQWIDQTEQCHCMLTSCRLDHPAKGASA